jgi:chromate transporter
MTAFGGPVAHLGYFREEFVVRRRWLTERAYADLVALCQFLPGAASSQVGMALGLIRAGRLGALAAWAGFTLPSGVAMILLALSVSTYRDAVPPGALHGLKIVAVAVVAQAVWGMARNLCAGARRVTVMATASCVALVMPAAWTQVAVIGAAAVAGRLLLDAPPAPPGESLPIATSRRAGLAWLGAFGLLLAGLPVLTATLPDRSLAMVDAFYRAGALVFGGGHVVLPLLRAEVVPAGWVSEEAFLAGYGTAQALPGPLFAFSAFLGASMTGAPTGWVGGLLCLCAIFAPSFLLVFGALPYWERLRRNAGAQAALAGVNAAVVGLLLAALYDPVWTSAIHGPRHMALALVAFVALAFWRFPPWLVVAATALAGGILSL